MNVTVVTASLGADKAEAFFLEPHLDYASRLHRGSGESWLATATALATTTATKAIAAFAATLLLGHCAGHSGSLALAFLSIPCHLELDLRSL